MFSLYAPDVYLAAAMIREVGRGTTYLPVPARGTPRCKEAALMTELASTR